MDGWGLFLDFERYRSKGGALKLELYLFHTHVASGLTWVLILESEIARNSVSRRRPFPREKLQECFRTDLQVLGISLWNRECGGF